MNEALTFSVVAGNAMPDEQWGALAALFSAEYGTYSEKPPVRPGQRIRLGVPYYKRSYATADYRVALCRAGERLIAEAVYREDATSRGRVALVVQLVVAQDMRQRGIASTLLHAVWGFSDYYAWRIVTSNAFTVTSLEAATFRRVNPSIVQSERAWLEREVLAKIPFLANAAMVLDGFNTRIATGFFTDRRSATPATSSLAERLGALNEGEEWLAVVFRHQFPDEYLVRDRRFTTDELAAWASACGLQVLSQRFVRAGFKVAHGVSTGKEILLFLQRREAS